MSNNALFFRPNSKVIPYSSTAYRSGSRIIAGFVDSLLDANKIYTPNTVEHLIGSVYIAPYFDTVSKAWVTGTSSSVIRLHFVYKVGGSVIFNGSEYISPGVYYGRYGGGNLGSTNFVYKGIDISSGYGVMSIAYDPSYNYAATYGDYANLSALGQGWYPIYKTGNYVYVITSSLIGKIDVTNPAAPTVTTFSLGTSGNMLGEMVGTKLYLAKSTGTTTVIYEFETATDTLVTKQTVSGDLLGGTTSALGGSIIDNIFYFPKAYGSVYGYCYDIINNKINRYLITNSTYDPISYRLQKFHKDGSDLYAIGYHGSDYSSYATWAIAYKLTAI